METLRNKNVLKLFFLIFFSSFFFHSIHQWMGYYFSLKYSYSQFLISSLFTISTMMVICAESLGGFLSSRYGSGMVASLGFFIMSLFVWLLLFGNYSHIIFAIIALWGFGWGFNHVGLSSILTGLPDKYLSNSSSLNSSLRFLSGGSGSYVGGKIISLWGFEYNLMISGFFIFILSILSYFSIHHYQGFKNRPKAGIGTRPSR